MRTLSTRWSTPFLFPDTRSDTSPIQCPLFATSGKSSIIHDVVDMAKQVEHWRKSAIEDLEVAGDLLRARRIRHSLFFMHLAVEKALKGLVCRHTGDLAPRTHNLATLAEKTGIQLL